MTVCDFRSSFSPKSKERQRYYNVSMQCSEVAVEMQAGVTHFGSHSIRYIIYIIIYIIPYVI
jgi:hypothetical protein